MVSFKVLVSFAVLVACANAHPQAKKLGEALSAIPEALLGQQQQIPTLIPEGNKGMSPSLLPNMGDVIVQSKRSADVKEIATPFAQGKELVAPVENENEAATRSKKAIVYDAFTGYTYPSSYPVLSYSYQYHRAYPSFPYAYSPAYYPYAYGPAYIF